jgi:CheY-like chemotaxis protein
VAFSVTDTGIGIPASKQRLIFEAFQQADGTTSREYGGTGLGLSISRELARLLGGEIRVQSTPGQGSTFKLYLPLSYETTADYPPAHEPPPEPERRLALPRIPESRIAESRIVESTLLLPEEAPPEVAGDGELDDKKILVVDDDIRNVFALTSALEAHGMQVLHAESGKEGIELLKHTPGIEAVLMDVMMPGLDGLDTMRIIRQLDGYQQLPIIAVTAKAMMGDRDKCLAAGATDYVAKPVNMDLLLETLRRMLPQDAH